MEAVLIGCSFALGLLSKRIGLPPLVGFLVAGFALNAVGVEGGEPVEVIAHYGVLLLLFTVGLKVRLKNFVRPEVWGTGLIHLGLSAGLFGTALHFALGVYWTTALMLGVALGFSSTVIAAKMLDEKRELRAFHGRVSIGILIVQDLVAVALLTVAGPHSPNAWSLLVLAVPLARPLLMRLLTMSGHDEVLVLFGVALALIAGGLFFESLGLSSELGALVMGALVADHPRAHELGKALWGLKEAALVAFFLSIGMSGLPTMTAIGFAIALNLLLPLKTLLFVYILSRFKLRARTSFLTGLSLSSYSEFGLIFAVVAAESGLLSEELVVFLALTIAMSFVIAAPLNRFAHGLYERYAPLLDRIELAEKHPDDAPISLGSAEIVIFGMGRVGTGAFDFLKGRNERVIGLDSDPAKVQRHIAEGRRVGFADGEDPGLWQRLKLDGVRAVLLAMPDLEAKRIAARQLRRCGFDGLISATNVFSDEIEAIIDAGCNTTFNYFEEAGVGFAEHTWEALHGPQTARSPAAGE